MKILAKIRRLWHYFKVFVLQSELPYFMQTNEYRRKYQAFQQRQRQAMDEKSTLSTEEITHNESWGRFMFAFMYYTDYNIFETMTETD